MTQAKQFGESWSYIRDFQNRGVSQDDARELLHITRIEFAPPSRAHVKRLKRERPTVLTLKRRDPLPDAAHVAYNQRDRDAKAIVRLLKPDFKTPMATRCPNPRKPYVHVPAPLPKSEREHDARQAETNSRTALRRDHLVALGKCRRNLLSAKLSLEILEIFGDFDKYLEAIS